MALQKQLVPFPEIQGLDTKVDIKQELPGFLRKAENLVYETLKLLKKRFGYDALPLSILGSTDLENAKKLTKYNTELVALTEDSLLSYADSRGKWVSKGTLYPAQTTSSSIFKSAGTQTSIDVIVVDNFRVAVWEDASAGVRYSVQDNESLSFLVSNGLIEAGAEMPVVANIANTVYVLYGNGANIKYKSFSILEPATLSAATTVASNRDTTDGLIDCRTEGTAIACAYNANNAGDNLIIFKILEDGTPSSLIGVNGETASDALNVYVDPNSRIIVTYSDGTDFKVTIYAFNLNAAILPPTLVESAVVSACSSIINGSSYRLYYEVAQVGTSNNYVKQADLTLGGTVSGVAVFVRSVGLAADVFSYNGTNFIPTVHESSLQATYFLFNASGILVTKWFNQTAGGSNLRVLPSVSPTSASSFIVGSQFRNRIKGDGLSFFSTTGVGVGLINFQPTSCYSNAELANGLHICAGVLKYYDGATVTEHGFSIFPEVLTNPSNATTGGGLTDGSRGYKAVYRWTDNNGRDHRSAPTLQPLEITLTGGTSTQTSTVRVPTLRITDKESVVLELYRTEDAGTTYYKVTDDLAPVLNNKAVDYIDIVDTLADTALLSKEPLYTTGDVLENLPAPAAFQVCVYNGERLAIVGEQANRVYFSKTITEEGPVEFTDVIYRDVDPIGGPITAIINTASKLIIFEEDATFFVAGEGPLNTGVDDTMSKSETVATDIGCVNPDSLALTPDGLLFKSRKGLWFLGGNLSMQYTGAPVEAYNGDTVTAASIVGDLNQVRFLLSDSRALVYNYNLNRWATFENHGGLSSVVIGNQYYYIREDGAIYKENRNKFADNSSPIKMRIETGWLSAGDLQGYQRIYHALILASFKSAHKLRVKVAYDFVDAYVDDCIVDPTLIMDTGTYGGDDFYGATSPYGGDGSLYQIRVDFQRQKCQAIKLLIEDAQAEASEGLTISGITFRVGMKEGTNKVPASNQVGTE